jgi:hypothetical protein
MHDLAIDACPKPLSFLCSHELAEIRILARIKRTETMGAILVRDVVTRIVFAICFACGFQGFVNRFSY